MWLRDLFAAGPQAAGSQMAARTEAPFGTAETVAAACAVLAQDLLDALQGPAATTRDRRSP